MNLKGIFLFALLTFCVRYQAQDDEFHVHIPEPSICLPFNDTMVVFEVAEVSPEYPGGMEKLYEFLANNIKFPEISSDGQTQGKVYVTFVISETGTVQNVEILKSLDSLLEAEVLRVIKLMPSWIPGKINDENVKVRFTLPINIHYD